MQYGECYATVLASGDEEVDWGTIRQRRGAMKIIQHMVGKKDLCLGSL